MHSLARRSDEKSSVVCSMLLVHAGRACSLARDAVRDGALSGSIHTQEEINVC